MSIKAFLRDKLFFIIVVLITVLLGDFFLYAFHFPVAAILLLDLIYLLGGFGALAHEYINKKSYYNELFAVLENLGKKHYISEMISPADFEEGRMLSEVLGAAGKSMNDELAAEHKANREYREYVELWVHEIKTPISAAKLLCDNNGYTNVSGEVDKIERYVEQALFYARSGSAEKDYVIKQINIKKLIGELLKKNAAILISSGIKVEPNADSEVLSDSKWLAFILQQLLDNAIKYGAKTITFNFSDHVLSIKDDGIGIPPQDLPRIFERGFTGENGRTSAKATGMGLYICAQLCEKLGLTISAVSEKGTEISITFPQNPYIRLS